VKDVVGSLAINPNTVLRAYRELDLEGVTEGRRGVGTFVSDGVASLPPGDVNDLRGTLQRWVAQARAAGLDNDDMAALFAEAVRPRIARVA
jgi:GntR family transcriptional regulator